MDPKSPLKSLTLWSAGLTLLGVILKSFGVNIDDQLPALNSALPVIIQVIGIVGVVVGRVRPGAATPITRDQAIRQQIAMRAQSLQAR